MNAAIITRWFYVILKHNHHAAMSLELYNINLQRNTVKQNCISKCHCEACNKLEALKQPKQRIPQKFLQLPHTSVIKIPLKIPGYGSGYGSAPKWEWFVASTTFCLSKIISSSTTSWVIRKIC